MNKAKLRERVKKLKALASGNPNTHEADAALTKAAELAALLSTKAVRGIFEKIPGSGAWWIRYTDATGRYRREKVGAFGLAQKVLDKRRGEAVTGKKLPEQLRPKYVSFVELADDAVSYVKGKYSRPADDVARLELLKEHFPGAADSIKPKDIKRVLDTLTEKNKWSASTRNHHHNLISVAFRLGIESEKVEINPARAVRRQKEDNNRVRFLTPDEEKKLRDAIQSKSEWAEHESEFDLALNTGLRRSSMYLNLNWENVDLLTKTLKIERTKNGEPITLPLNADAMKALNVFRVRGDGTGRVVRNASGETLNVTAHWFPHAVRASGIKPFRWHNLRHTFASRLRQRGVDLGTIAELLGHSPKSGFAMTKRYAHLSITNLHEAVSRIANLNSTPVAPEPHVEVSESSTIQ